MARILVIDDDQLVRGTIEVMLASEGHDVTAARNGHEGIAQFRSDQFDLVICDIFMPDKEGLETIREIRGLSATVPVIAITGGLAPAANEADVNFLHVAQVLGATQTLAKPFRRQELLALVQGCLDATGRLRG